jgi:AcrR family transcriptional regulator
MADQESTTEQKIIEAAIQSIERYGIQGTTNRKIAEIAGVNNAAINYYFRSKDALVQRCMEVTLDNAFDWKDFSKLPYGTPRERCQVVFNDLIVGGTNFPGLTRSHFYDLFASGSYDILGLKKYNEFIERLAQELEGLGSDLSHDELRLALVQIASSVIMMILAPGMFAERFHIDMRVEADRKVFLERLINRLL